MRPIRFLAPFPFTRPRALALAISFLVLPWMPRAEACCYYRHGDGNLDGSVDVSDAVFLLNFLYQGGPRPMCPNSADANADGALDQGDAVTIIGNLFGGSVPPLLPTRVLCRGPLPSAPEHDTTGPIVQRSESPTIGKPAFIVVHTSQDWDNRCYAKPGVDLLVSRFAGGNPATALPVVYIVESIVAPLAARWYTQDRQPYRAIVSSDGSYTSLAVTTPQVTLAGGFLRECWKRALNSTVKSFFSQQAQGARTLTIHVPMDAVFDDRESTAHPSPLLIDKHEAAGNETYLSAYVYTWCKNAVTDVPENILPPATRLIEQYFDRNNDGVIQSPSERLQREGNTTNPTNTVKFIFWKSGQKVPVVR